MTTTVAVENRRHCVVFCAAQSFARMHINMHGHICMRVSHTDQQAAKAGVYVFPLVTPARLMDGESE